MKFCRMIFLVNQGALVTVVFSFFECEAVLCRGDAAAATGCDVFVRSARSSP
jgi:hypothetical protein